MVGLDLYQHHHPYLPPPPPLSSASTMQSIFAAATVAAFETNHLQFSNNNNSIDNSHNFGKIRSGASKRKMSVPIKQVKPLDLRVMEVLEQPQVQDESDGSGDSSPGIMQEVADPLREAVVQLHQEQQRLEPDVIANNHRTAQNPSFASKKTRTHKCSHPGKTHR